MGIMCSAQSLIFQLLWVFRDVMEIKESEQRAHSQAEVLKNALNEHGLELRVKAAKEAEVACQQRLSAAEAEIADLRVRLDASDRLQFHTTSLNFFYCKILDSILCRVLLCCNALAPVLCTFLVVMLPNNYMFLLSII